MIELDQESCRDLNTSDGDAPHAPRGCLAQAWSVAELLRVVADLETTYQTDLNDVIGEQIFSFHS